eukprot:COSAG05_NODE_13308_length_434_cov_1.492537_1_plen_55_part_00
MRLESSLIERLVYQIINGTIVYTDGKGEVRTGPGTGSVLAAGIDSDNVVESGPD